MRKTFERRKHLASAPHAQKQRESEKVPQPRGAREGWREKELSVLPQILHCPVALATMRQYCAVLAKVRH